MYFQIEPDSNSNSRHRRRLKSATPTLQGLVSSQKGHLFCLRCLYMRTAEVKTPILPTKCLSHLTPKPFPRFVSLRTNRFAFALVVFVLAHEQTLVLSEDEKPIDFQFKSK